MSIAPSNYFLELELICSSLIYELSYESEIYTNENLLVKEKKGGVIKEIVLHDIMIMDGSVVNGCSLTTDFLFEFYNMNTHIIADDGNKQH